MTSGQRVSGIQRARPHSSVLAWGAPGTGEAGGLPSMGSHSRIRLKRLSNSSSKQPGASQMVLVWSLPTNAGDAKDLGSIPGLGRSPGEGKDYPLQFSGLENSMDDIVHGVAKSKT